MSSRGRASKDRETTDRRVSSSRSSPRSRVYSYSLAVPRIFAYYRDRIFRADDASFVGREGKRGDADADPRDGGDMQRGGHGGRRWCIKGRGDGEETERSDEARKGGEEEERTRDKTPAMRRRYATEYHYPDNGPAISSAACINLRVKGQDTRYLNK